MGKSGTVKSAGHAAVAASKGARHGPASKNVVSGGRSAGRPSAPTAPLKGPDRGGV